MSISSNRTEVRSGLNTSRLFDNNLSEIQSEKSDDDS